MKIGIIGAMEEEVTLLRDKIENRTKHVITTRMSRHLVMNTVSYQAVRQALKLTIN